MRSRIPFFSLLIALALLLAAAGCTQPSATTTTMTTTTTAPATVTAVNNATANETMVAFVKEAVAYAQTHDKEAALQEFSNPHGSFVRGELYLYAYDFNGTTLAHPFNPEMIGVNRLAEPDAQGGLFIKDLRDAALNGTGFVRFYYINPAHNRTVEPKLGYVERVNDDWFLGSGIYERVPETTATATADASPRPVVYIVYGTIRDDGSYNERAYAGLLAAQKNRSFTAKEFDQTNAETLVSLLNTTSGAEKPGLVITLGYQYANLTRHLAAEHPDIRFLAIDQSGIGSENVNAYEITSYGNSYLAGTLAASATKSGQVGCILGSQSELMDAFLQGYTDGARAANPSVIVDHAYVHQYSTDGFSDPAQAGRVAEGMYRNGTDVIYAVAGSSGTGVIAAAGNASGRYVIGVDTDQSSAGPSVVLASAVKEVDAVVSAGIQEHLNGSFTGGDQVAGLRDGATGIVFNPAFARYNVSAYGAEAQEAEERYLASRGL